MVTPTLRRIVLLSLSVVLFFVLIRSTEPDKPDIGQLRNWNRETQYDSTLAYLAARLPVWKQRGQTEFIARSFHYYFYALKAVQEEGLADSLDYYEQFIREHPDRDKPYLSAFISAMRADHLMPLGYIDSARTLLSDILRQYPSLDKQEPELVAELYSSLSFLSAVESDYATALEYNHKSDDIYLRILGESHHARLSTLNNYNIIYSGMGRYRLALDYALKTRDIVHTTYGAEHINQARILNNLSTIYWSIGQHDKAIGMLKEAAEANRRKGRDFQLMQNYYNLAGVCLGKLDYDAAFHYLEQTQAVLRQLEGDQTHFEIQLLNSFGSYYTDQGNLDSAQFYLSKALDLARNASDGDSYQEASLLLSIGFLKYSRLQYKEAIEDFLKALAIQLDYLGEEHDMIAHIYFYMATCYDALKDYARADDFFGKGYRIYLNIFGQGHTRVLDALSSIAGSAYQRGDYARAALLIDSFFIQNKDLDLDKYPYRIPPFDSLAPSAFTHEILLLKARLLVSEMKTPDKDTLKAVISLYDYIARELDRMLAEFGGYKGRDDLRKSSEDIFKEAVAACYQLYELSGEQSWVDKAYVFSERARGLKQQELMRNRLARQISGLPDSVVQQELSLRTHMQSLQEVLDQTSVSDTLIYNSAASELLAVREQHNRYVKHLESTYPRYYDLKYNVSVASPQDVRKHLLRSGETLVQYCVADSVTYLHLLTGKQHRFIRLNTGSDLRERISEWYDAIKKRDFAVADRIGYELYRRLIAPVAGEIGSTDLLIVPDEALYYINFEALPLTADKTSYLVEQHRVRYCYSPTVLVQSHQYSRHQKSDFDWVGFVPDFKSGDKTEYTPLPWASELAGEAAGFFRSLLLEGNKATASSFRQYASSGDILHIGTHAVADDSDPLNSYLVLSGETGGKYELVRGHDIFNTEINARCAVLTACETAVGSLKGGEGMVSLARAFSYAGCPNMVVTLWPVDDEQTSRIASSFYRHVADGRSFGDALHQAKAEYLSAARGDLRHPFYWAGLVYYGDQSDIGGNTGNWLLITAIAAGLGLIGVIFVRRSRSRTRQEPT